MRWPAYLAILLLTVTELKGCNANSREKIKEYARYLIYVYSFIPYDNDDSITLLEGYNLTDMLFSKALQANALKFQDITIIILDILLSWAFEASNHQTDWDILTRSCYATACLTLSCELNEDDLIKKITDHVSRQASAESLSKREYTVKQIEEKTTDYDNLPRHIKHEIETVNCVRLKKLLFRIAQQLTP